MITNYFRAAAATNFTGIGWRNIVSAVLAITLSFASQISARPALVPPVNEASAVQRQIIICVDGVGFSTIVKMREEGRFKQFRAPSRMISPFPTLTNLAMTEILTPAGANEAVGYEDSFFDVTKNRMRGGILDRLRGDRFLRGTFRELFDYHPSALKIGLGYAAPPLSTYIEALSDLVRLRQKARASRESVFIAYTGATDSLAHLGGEKMVRSFLARLDDTINTIVRDSKKPVAITIFSDHGNHYTKYQRVALKSPLKRAGFRLESRVRDAKSVVLPQFGLVGCGVLFTQESNEARLAETLAKIRGVDFAAYGNDGAVHILSCDGRASITRRGDRYRYESSQGDPLGLKTIARQLVAEGKADAEGFIADADWFASTCDTARPDAVRRVFEGVAHGVSNRANVIVNLEDGYYTGSAALDVFAFLQATHGNAGREQSLGFVMSTEGELPKYLRADDVWKAAGSPRLNKSLRSRDEGK